MKIQINDNTPLQLQVQLETLEVGEFFIRDHTLYIKLEDLPSEVTPCVQKSNILNVKNRRVFPLSQKEWVYKLSEVTINYILKTQ